MNNRKLNTRRTARSAKAQSHAVKRVGRFGRRPDPGRLHLPVGEDLNSALPGQRVQRSIQPRLETLGLGCASFQVLRKTNASLSKKTGVDPKVASDQRGHGIAVSLDVYSPQKGTDSVDRDTLQKTNQSRPSPPASESQQRRARLESKQLLNRNVRTAVFFL